MKVEWWPIDRPKPYEKNARKIPQKAIDKVALSLREFGWQQPISVDKHGVIVAGHTRLLAAKQEKHDKVPVVIASNLTPAQIRAYRIMDNRSHQETEWDDDILGLELGELKGLDLDLGLTGFDPSELDKLFGIEKAAPEAEMDRAEELLAKWKVERGQVWQIGRHRLMCGDCTNREDVAELMEGERAGLMATDPPYGIDYDSAELHEHGVSYARIDGDKHQDELLQQFLERAFRTAVDVAILPNAAWYLWHAMLTQGFFAAAAAAAHVILHRQIIWVKPVLVFGRGQYHWKHELCFMGWIEKHQPPDYGDHTETTVWEVAGVPIGDRRTFSHSTPKPVELFRRPIVKHLNHGELCYEPFSGSGPQFVAAEELDRRCYGLEIEPKYCAVILERMAAMGVVGELAKVPA